jgi:hypothetical protein
MRGQEDLLHDGSAECAEELLSVHKANKPLATAGDGTAGDSTSGDSIVQQCRLYPVCCGTGAEGTVKVMYKTCLADEMPFSSNKHQATWWRSE